SSDRDGRAFGEAFGRALRRRGSERVWRRSREKRKHARFRVHAVFGGGGAARAGATVARGADSGEGIRVQGHREKLRDRQRTRAAQSILPLPSRAARARHSRSSSTWHASGGGACSAL